MKLQDERLDYEAQMDKKYDKEQGLKEEIITLQEKLDGKDQAIKALS